MPPMSVVRYAKMFFRALQVGRLHAHVALRCPVFLLCYLTLLCLVAPFVLVVLRMSCSPPLYLFYVVLYALLLLFNSVSVRACLCPQRSALGEADACDAVAMVMAMFPDHRLIQVEACRAVEALADGNEENVRLLGDAVSFFRKE